MAAIDAVGQAAGPFAHHAHRRALRRVPGISVKLSALHPRFEPGKEERLAARAAAAAAELAARRALARPVASPSMPRSRTASICRSTCSRATFTDPALDGWNGLGLAVQAYGKRAIPVLRWLRRLAERSGKRIPVRLVKGAYWDSEIKWAQERGLADYPVFTRKLTPTSPISPACGCCLSDPKASIPQFATHNAHTLAAVHVAGGASRLRVPAPARHGRGALRGGRRRRQASARPCRIYAPVGGHEDLLAYLVRRLLENGANTSFVNRLADEEAPIADDHPRSGRDGRARAQRSRDPARFRRPREIYLPERASSARPGADRAGGARELLSPRCGDALDDVVRGRPHRRRQATTGGDAASLVHLPARPARAHRHGAHRRRRRKSSAALERAADAPRALGRAGRRRPRRRSSSTPPTSSSATARA